MPTFPIPANGKWGKPINEVLNELHDETQGTAGSGGQGSFELPLSDNVYHEMHAVIGATLEVPPAADGSIQTYEFLGGDELSTWVVSGYESIGEFDSEGALVVNRSGMYKVSFSAFLMTDIAGLGLAPGTVVVDNLGPGIPGAQAGQWTWWPNKILAPSAPYEAVNDTQIFNLLAGTRFFVRGWRKYSVSVYVDLSLTPMLLLPEA